MLRVADTGERWPLHLRLLAVSSGSMLMTAVLAAKTLANFSLRSLGP
ncbi:hypothetical protein FOVG_19927 [Fusarium oxysporum f. sp. pisi HDV247]|uniref:Uncharacterized protein n=1 Tax=Fusarium oxysporum f. sp. pisi HDV247 TaxID=1080344 RepID=W9NKQ9_FUSOX|nr:hypothetical protein FOVG_19927 [Fusarium oxysporum f. sp. pisi HDV247]